MQPLNCQFHDCDQPADTRIRVAGDVDEYYCAFHAQTVRARCKSAGVMIVEDAAYQADAEAPETDGFAGGWDAAAQVAASACAARADDLEAARALLEAAAHYGHDAAILAAWRDPERDCRAAVVYKPHAARPFVARADEGERNLAAHFYTLEPAIDAYRAAVRRLSEAQPEAAE